MKIIEGNTDKNCDYQLTDWTDKKSDIEFALTQVEKEGGNYQIKANGVRIAIFTDFIFKKEF